ncbi:MAG: hypothetical protein LIQ31_06270, partial [Planctomycetes bacterium]|nr:hypothetical protein [Planctomycetota bacterium]
MTNYATLQGYLQSSGSAGRNTATATAAGIQFSVDVSVDAVEPAETTVEDVKKEFAAFLDSL